MVKAFESSKIQTLFNNWFSTFKCNWCNLNVFEEIKGRFKYNFDEHISEDFLTDNYSQIHGTHSFMKPNMTPQERQAATHNPSNNTNDISKQAEVQLIRSFLFCSLFYRYQVIAATPSCVMFT